MPPRADLESAFKAALKGFCFGVLACVLWLTTDWEKIDEYLNATFLQLLLAITYEGLLITLCKMCFSSFRLVVYYLPRYFWHSRIVMGVSCLLCFHGAIYYGDRKSASREVLCGWGFERLLEAIVDDYFGW